MKKAKKGFTLVELMVVIDVYKRQVHDKDRPSAIAKMRSALGELVIEGITTNVDFQYELIGDRDFEDGNVDTDFIPSHFPDC